MSRLFALLVAIAFGGFLLAQEPAKEQVKETPHVQSVNPDSYSVQFVEYRVSTAIDSKLAPQQILESLEAWTNEGKVQLAESVRLSAIEGIESTVQFGRRSSVVVGTVSLGGGRGTQRSMQSLELGTLVQVMIVPHGDKTNLKFNYESSRFDGEPKEDASPDTVTTKLKSTLAVDLGKPTLICSAGSVSKGTSSLLVVTITKQP